MKKLTKRVIETGTGFAFKRPVAADRDYSDLIGKVVVAKYEDGVEFPCIVDEVEYDIGISVSFTNITEEHLDFFGTLQRKKDEKAYCLCANGPSSPRFNSIVGQDKYNAKFFSTVRSLRKGVFDHRMFKRLESRGSGDMAGCAFTM